MVMVADAKPSANEVSNHRSRPYAGVETSLLGARFDYLRQFPELGPGRPLKSIQKTELVRLGKAENGTLE